ncbi:MAG: S9 family peptidase [Candidatus Aminicenantes bacterium]|nr:S9 family peptidase [Candidatus Aminicenantes bacterium]
MTKRLSAFLSVPLVFLAVFAPCLSAQEPYKTPPKEILDILNSPPTPRVTMSPDRTRMLLVESESMPTIDTLSQPLLRIAGMRITPANNSRQVMVFNTSLTLKTIQDGREVKIELPEGIKFSRPSFSEDGKWISFARYLDNGVELWIADTATGKAKALTPPRLNMVVGNIVWMPGNKKILAVLVPENRGPAPVEPRIPIGPTVQVSGGKQAMVATYQDMLKSPYDETLFEYYATGQPAFVDIATGQIEPFGRPGIYGQMEPSPDGNFILVTRIKRPFSYSVGADEFARSVEICDLAGKTVKVVADLPPAENVPLSGVPTGPRRVFWQTLKPATLSWIEALDGGDPKTNAEFRDKLMALDAPFTNEAREVLKTKERFGGLSFFQTPGLALATESNRRAYKQVTWLVNLDNPAVAPKKFFDLNTQDAYANPGSPVMGSFNGERVILQDKDWIYLSGQGASPKGDRPFLDRMNLKTGEKQRLFQCVDGKYQTFVGFFGQKKDEIIISQESASEVPNYHLLALKSKKTRPLTSFADPAPQMTGVKKQRIKYKREDGVDLSGTLYLPADYKEGTRLPVVIWAYPLEYGSADTAGQVRGSTDRFTFYRGTSQLFFVTQGYAVLDSATMPVVGDSQTVNDTFVTQIVANAKAAIDTLDKMGVGDPKRVGVGGHSYGAFMTANLLAHCDLFAAGIARSGAYNRTLTPFGFQSERRTLWEARDTYLKMSPFMYADKIKTPILLIHGMADNNSGTFPIQSERLFAALKGFGATSRFVYLPYESHGYSARESVFTVLAEMIEWFDLYVKNRK